MNDDDDRRKTIRDMYNLYVKGIYIVYVYYFFMCEKKKTYISMFIKLLYLHCRL